MRFSIVTRYTGLAVLLNALFMALSAVVSLFYNVDTGFYPLLMAALLTAIIGSFPMIFVASDTNISNKESVAIVVLSWIAASLVGTLPYVLWGGEFSFINSWFESVSGYTTTGATILQDVEALPRSLMFWRSCTHMIGGAGIIIFTLIVLPATGKSRVALSNVELSTLAKDNYKYRVDKLVKIMLSVYTLLIIGETIALKCVGMGWFDALNHSMSTIATGGFSTKNLSVAHYNNLGIELVIMFFMILSGMHFGLLFSSITTRKNSVFKSEVSKFYLLTILVATIIITLNLWGTETYSILDSLRYASFQFISIITTTGFATVDTALWPPLAVLVLLFYTIHCSCAGSTAGGIKADRIIILMKTFKARILQQQHPNAIFKIKLNKTIVQDQIVNTVAIFIALYMFTLVVLTLILTAMNIDLMTSFSAIAASLGNVGPGFGEVSSLSNFSSFPATAKFICTIAMLLGRLELFGFIQIFLIKSWK